MNGKIQRMKDGLMCTKLLSVIGCVLMLSVCAAPCNAQQPEDPWNIDSDIYSGDFLIADGTLNLNAGAIVFDVWLLPGGTLNMYAGAQVLDIIYVQEDTTLNFHGGWVGDSVWFPTLQPGQAEPMVTVEGKDFMLQDGTGSPYYSVTGGFTPMPGHGSTLEGFYPSSVPGEADIPIHIKFYGPVYVTLVNLEPEPEADAEAEIDIDIKPGSDTNPINLKAKGLVPVAILSTNGFDASTVDSSTVRLEGIAPVRSTMEDVDGVGEKDMLLFFETEDLAPVLTESSTEATLTGQTLGGTAIHGTDVVQIVPSKKK